jgi:ubiquinone/menaquinone biosynthesis C-methylase UbiE
MNNDLLDALSLRKTAIRNLEDKLAPFRNRWIARNRFFYEEDTRFMRFLVLEGLRVLDCGCGTGSLLASLKPARGVGVDFSAKMIEIASRDFPGLEFHVGDIEQAETLSNVGGPFDVIMLSDTVGSLDDCQKTLSGLHRFCTPDTRIVISYYSRMWDPILKLAETLRLKMPQMEQNVLSTEDIENILQLSDFEVVKREWRQLLPLRLLGIGTLINRYVSPLPMIRRACLRNYVVARPVKNADRRSMSVSIVIPCRNEKGNIEPIVQRLPRICHDMEILFVEGHSSDGTFSEIKRVIGAYPQYDIKVLVQDGKGKGNAVRKGFAHARGDALIILDADMTVPPEDLPKFYEALLSGKGEFINGTRLVYPLEQDAMRFLNYLANHIFSWLFTWLLNQRFTDTLCGTKALTKENYLKISANRAYFGDFDPFGDFDLIFGASKLNFKVIEVPVRYRARAYGETQISRFRHGLLLLRMVLFAYRKLKAF